MSAAAVVCARCGAAIAPDELAQGLAVRLESRPVCPSCVDGLPAPARERIDRLRRLHGLGRRTCRMALKRLPTVAAYTFSTAAALHLHRRIVAAGGTFAAPPYQPPRRWRGDILLVTGVGILAALGLWWLAQSTAPPASPDELPPPGPEVPLPPPPPSPPPIIFPALDDEIDASSPVSPASSALPRSAPASTPMVVRAPALAIPSSPAPMLAPSTSAPVPSARAVPASAPSVPSVPSVPERIVAPPPSRPAEITLLAPAELAAALVAAPLPWPTLAWGAGGPIGRELPDAGRAALSRRGELSFGVPAAAVRDGGLLLLLHPGDARRTAVSAWCDDRPLAPLACPSPQWGVHVLSLPGGGDTIRVRLADRSGISTPFALGPLIGVAGAQPRNGWLRAVTAHLPAALATRAGDDALRQRLAAADGVRRRAGDPTFAAEPGLLRRVRVAGGGLPPAAVTVLRARLADLQGAPCRRGQVEEGGEPGADGWSAWFRQAQLLAPSQARRLAPGEQYGVLLVLSPGADDRHAVAGTIALAQELRELERLVLVGEPRERRPGGLVLVLGVGGFDPAGQALPDGLAAARAALRRACDENGTPRIDLGAVGDWPEGKGARVEALARVLGDSLACLTSHIIRLAPGKP